MVETYGRRRVPLLIQKIQHHRDLIRTEGSPEMQASWDSIEEFIDFLYERVAQRQKAEDEAAQHKPAAPV
jgi:hypothetical protein